MIDLNKTYTAHNGDTLVAKIKVNDDYDVLVQWGGKGAWERDDDMLAVLLFPNDFGYTVS